MAKMHDVKIDGAELFSDSGTFTLDTAAIVDAIDTAAVEKADALALTVSWPPSFTIVLDTDKLQKFLEMPLHEQVGYAQRLTQVFLTKKKE